MERVYRLNLGGRQRAEGPRIVVGWLTTVVDRLVNMVQRRPRYPPHRSARARMPDPVSATKYPYHAVYSIFMRFL